MMDFIQNNSPMAAELARIIFQMDRLSPPIQSQNGLRRSEFMFLAALAHNIAPGSAGIKASDLSNLLEITPGAVSHVLNELEKNGYVDRISDPKDRRIVLIHPTENGLEILSQAYNRMIVGLNGLVEYLGVQDSQEFIRLFTLAIAYFKQISDQHGGQETQPGKRTVPLQ
jgi:DNA-binding MarR family transcriptional regulator